MGISVEWPAHPPLVGGWGCVNVVSEHKLV